MKNPKYLYPLRKVVGGKDIPIGIRDLTIFKFELECGHLASQPHDIYGNYYPNKIRCAQCWSELTDEQRSTIIAKSEKRIEQRKQREWNEWRKYSRRYDKM